MQFPNKLVALTGLVIVLAACSVTTAPNESAALEKAYASGVLTADEYAAKKAALTQKVTALAALDKALATGVVTQEEYAAKKAALLASQPPPAAVPQAPPASLAAPQPAGVAQQDTPPPPALAALPAPQTAKPAPTQQAAGGHTYQMKRVQVIDQYGFEKPIPSGSMLIPVDWQSQAATTWNIKDTCNTVQTTLKASGPDGRAFELFPTYNWVWADNPTPLKQAAAQKAQYGSHACDVLPPMSAADYAKQIIGRIRPNTRISSIEPAPELLEKIQQQAKQAEQMAAQYGLQQRVRADVAKARLKYTLNGQNVEEWIVVATVVTATLGPSYDVRTMRMTQAYTYNCRATMLAERAPAGQLDANVKFFDLLSSTYRIDPAWQSRVIAGAQRMQQIELKGIRDRSAIVTKNAEDIRNIQQKSFENQQRAQDESFRGFDQVIRGVESYRNPSTGETVELDSTYGHAWAAADGTYLLTDQSNFNPNSVSTKTWTPLEHVKP